jgi:hypothetical protein
MRAATATERWALKGDIAKKGTFSKGRNYATDKG